MNYIKPIIIFAAIGPFFIICAVALGLYLGWGWVDSEFQRRSEAYEGLMESKRIGNALDAENAPHRGAVAFFEEARDFPIVQELPPYIENIVNTTHQGSIIRTGFKVDGEGTETERFKIDFLGRYDALQRMLGELEAEFPFLKVTMANFRVGNPSASVPTRHLNVNVEATNNSNPEGGSK